MYKVLSEFLYEGEFKNVKYTKVVLVVSENDNFPKIISVNPDVYADVGQKLTNKKINIYFSENFGKFKVSKIELVD